MKARDDFSPRASYNCRQRPTLPHSFPCSTIGGSKLNFRVRNGNGCDPAPMTTGMLGAWGPAFARCVGFGGQARSSLFAASCPPKAERCEGGSSQTMSKSQPAFALTLRLATEYLTNGSLTDSRHAAFPRALCVAAGSSDRRTKIYGQASRLISIGKLNVSPRLHTRPITW